MIRCAAAATLATGLLLVVPGSASAQLSVLPGPAGCTAQSGDRQCQSAPGLLSPRALAVDGGGRVFVAAQASHALTALRRGTDGRLLFSGCLSDDGTDGRFGYDGVCVDGDGLREPVAVAMHPRGGRAYVAGRLSNSLAVVRTDTGWAPERVSCFTDRTPGGCADAVALGAPEGIGVSPDGAHVYVAARATDGVIPFAIDPWAGVGAQRGCVTDNGTDGVCADGDALRGVRAVAVSPDGRHVYAAAFVSQAIAGFLRAADGSLGQFGCVEHLAPAGNCVSVVGLRGIRDIALSADGHRLYAVAEASAAVSVFARDPDSGALRQVSCLAVDPEPGCTEATGLRGANSVAVTPSGSIVVTAAVDDAVVELTDDREAGALRPRACVSAATIAGCARATAVAGPVDVVVAADGRIHVAASDRDAVLTLGAGPTVAASVVRASHRRAAVPVRCPRARQGPCRGRILLERRHRRLGSGAFRVLPGLTRRVAVRLRAHPARRRVRARASVRESRTRSVSVAIVLDARKHRCCD